MEGHGTSTRVGDAVELSALAEAFGGADLAPGSVALGSAKSNIGHLKSAAGAAGLLKATLAVHEKVLPPSINFEQPNPTVDWSHSPFAVNTELREWDVPAGRTRVAGVSAFGFGGADFHLVLEEYVPGRPTTNGHHASATVPSEVSSTVESEPAGTTTALDTADVEQRVLAIVAEQTGYPTELLDMDLDLEADLGIDTVKQAELFAQVRGEYGIERDESLKLRDYPTLNHVVAFVCERAAVPQRGQAAARGDVSASL